MNLKNSLKHISHKTIALFIITAFLLPSFSLIIMVTAEEQIYQNITIDTANYMIKHENKYPNLVILDVRTSCEYEKGHLYNAILIPHDELEIRINELEEYKNTEIIVYCKSGYRSQLASEILVEYGFTKVYNILGGILAWIDANYPIWTSYHYITVNEIADTKFELLIEPLLLYYSGCLSCNENQECPSQSESINITSKVLEQQEDHITILNRFELNGTVYEFIHTHTILWSYNKFTSTINKSAYFISTEITSENYYLQYYQLEYLIYHNNYKLTIYTRLDPLNSETYNSSFTNLKYTPVNEKAITSMEFVQFNMSVILSQQYDILADIAEEMAKIYKKSEGLDIMELYYAYIDIKEGIASLSELVKEQLLKYDWQILESFAVLADIYTDNGGGYTPPPSPPPPPSDPLRCFFCEVGCGVALLLGCIIACLFYPVFCPLCIWIMNYIDVLHVSCSIACEYFKWCP